MNMVVEKETKMFDEVIHIIDVRKRNAYVKVNEELINMYWDVGKYVSEKVNNASWGSKTVERLADYIHDKYPNLKGFNRRGIYRMKQFYEMYSNDKIVSPLVTQISWSNNILIMSSTKSPEEREFYIKLCIKNNYKKRELARQLASSYYERYMLSAGKINPSVDKAIDEDDYPNTKILDMYSLEFLDLPNEYKEKDLKDALIHNMKNFILEIGKDFAFVGEEYRITVGGEDFFIDLLMYNRHLKCLVAFELKIGKFIPEYISKMDFYLEALDRDVKNKDENPSVGIILCSNKNNDVVKYAISRSMSPTMVANYTLNLPDKNILENKMSEIKKLFEK